MVCAWGGVGVGWGGLCDYVISFKFLKIVAWDGHISYKSCNKKKSSRVFFLQVSYNPNTQKLTGFLKISFLLDIEYLFADKR